MAKVGKLYRPRGVHKRTKRDSWISKVWYRSRKDAEDTVRMFGADKTHTNIRIITASNRTYKGKYIFSGSIATS